MSQSLCKNACSTFGLFPLHLSSTVIYHSVRLYVRRGTLQHLKFTVTFLIYPHWKYFLWQRVLCKGNGRQFIVIYHCNTIQDICCNLPHDHHCCIPNMKTGWWIVCLISCGKRNATSKVSCSSARICWKIEIPNRGNSVMFNTRIQDHIILNTFWLKFSCAGCRDRRLF